MIERNRRAVVTVTWLAAGLAAAAALANPTGRQPNRPLSAHGTIPEAKEMVPALYELYQEEEKFVIETLAKKDNPARFSDRQISKAAGRLWKARRDAERLKLMGEPAGDDLSKKLFRLAVEVDKFGLAYRGTPKGAQLVQRYAQQLGREKPRFTKFLQQADRAIGRGQLEAVETQLEAKGVQLYEKLVYFSPTARKPYNQLFNQVLGKNDSVLETKRKKAYQQVAAEAVKENLAPAKELAGEIQRIADELADSGTAKLAGDKSGGPAEALAHVTRLWGNASAGLLRATAIGWAFTNRANPRVQPSPQQIEEVAVRGLVSIIQAAATSTPADQVPAVYAELLKQISVAERRSGNYRKHIRTACQPALEQLAAKNPSLPGQIQAYQRATVETLRWRKLYAAQQAKHLSTEFPSVTASLNTKAPATDGIRPDFAGFRGREIITAPDVFGEPASWMVQEAASRLVGKPVAQQQMIRLSSTSRTAVVPFDGKSYGNVPVPMPSQEEVADLRAALLVDDSYPPLTIESANAISASQLHDYLRVAGVVQEVHLESVVTRFIGLPDIAYTLSPLGQTPALPENSTPLLQTCWRLDMKPMWAQHPCFTVRVTKK